MRKLIYAINITIDGGCDHTNGVPDDELFEYYTHLVRDADLLVFGRKTYQLMVAFFIGRMSQKILPRQKQIANLRTHLSPKAKLFFHNH